MNNQWKLNKKFLENTFNKQYAPTRVIARMIGSYTMASFLYIKTILFIFQIITSYFFC
jgi:hypothetical protein